jgi:hypothetical protein
MLHRESPSISRRIKRDATPSQLHNDCRRLHLDQIGYLRSGQEPFVPISFFDPNSQRLLGLRVVKEYDYPLVSPAFVADIQGSVIASIESRSGTLSKIGYLPWGKSSSPAEHSPLAAYRYS